MNGKGARFDSKGDPLLRSDSALHKSVRGSAPDAAPTGMRELSIPGGDPLYVARRCLAIASEDVGNTDPRAMQVAIAAWDCFTRVGPAEGERAISQAIVYLACAPKATLSTLRLKPRWPMLANVRIMTCRFICVMRRRN